MSRGIVSKRVGFLRGLDLESPRKLMGYLDFSSSERDRFVAEFDRRLRGRVEPNTIDWIWDQYVEHSKGGGMIRGCTDQLIPTDFSFFGRGSWVSTTCRSGLTPRDECEKGGRGRKHRRKSHGPGIGISEEKGAL